MVILIGLTNLSLALSLSLPWRTTEMRIALLTPRNRRFVFSSGFIRHAVVRDHLLPRGFCSGSTGEELRNSNSVTRNFFPPHSLCFRHFSKSIFFISFQFNFRIWIHALRCRYLCGAFSLFLDFWLSILGIENRSAWVWRCYCRWRHGRNGPCVCSM